MKGPAWWVKRWKTSGSMGYLHVQVREHDHTIEDRAHRIIRNTTAANVCWGTCVELANQIPITQTVLLLWVMCFLTWKLALDEVLSKMRYNFSLIYMVVGYLENSLHIKNLQKHFVFNMESAVRLQVQTNRLLTYRNILLVSPNACRMKDRSLLRGPPIPCSMPSTPDPSLMAGTFFQIIMTSPKCPHIPPECSLRSVLTLLMTTSLEMSWPLPGVASGWFLLYWKLCLSKSFPTLTLNSPWLNLMKPSLVPLLKYYSFFFKLLCYSRRYPTLCQYLKAMLFGTGLF